MMSAWVLAAAVRVPVSDLQEQRAIGVGGGLQQSHPGVLAWFACTAARWEFRQSADARS